MNDPLEYQIVGKFWHSEYELHISKFSVIFSNFKFQGYSSTPQINPSHHQYKPFYYQDSNVMNNSEETTIIDLDSNDGVQTVEEQQPESITPQPKGMHS